MVYQNDVMPIPARLRTCVTELAELIIRQEARLQKLEDTIKEMQAAEVCDEPYVEPLHHFYTPPPIEPSLRYRQCTLRCGDRRQVCWLPVRLAIKGAKLETNQSLPVLVDWVSATVISGSALVTTCAAEVGCS
jgi:hypothetical protein